MIKCVEERGLESQYPKDETLMCIKKLENEKADRKRRTAAPVPKPQQPPKHNGNRQGKAGPAPSAFKWIFDCNSVFRPPQPSSMKRQVCCKIMLLPYLGSSSGACRTSCGCCPMCGLISRIVWVVALSGASSNLNPLTSNSYNSEARAQAQPGYYNRVAGCGGYDVSSPYPSVYYT